MTAAPAFEKSAERPTAFLSYAREDRPFARRLADALTATGCDVRADWQLTSGEQYADALRTFILMADAFIFIISPDSAASPQCKGEIAIAVEHKKQILPVSYRDHGDDDKLDSAIRAPQWTLLTEADDFDAGTQGLSAAMRTDFELMDRHARLLLAADEWAKRNKGRGYLLHGEELTAAESWLKRTSDHPDKLPQPTPLELEFIFASQADRQRRARRTAAIATTVALVLVVLAAAAIVAGIKATRNGAEAQRQSGIAKQNEANAVRSAEEATRQAGIARENEQRARTQERLAEARRLEAEEQRGIATEQRDRAMSRALAASAIAQVSSDVNLSLLLGLEAARAAPTTEAEDALRQSMVQARQIPFDAAGPMLLSTSAVGTPARSPDGRLVLSAAGSVATLRTAGTAERVLRELRGHWDDITSVALSPDGRFAATGAEDRTARLWDLRTGEMLAVFLHLNPVSRVGFSADGEYVMTYVGYPPPGKPFAAYATKTGRALAELHGGGGVARVAFNPDGRQVLVISRDHTVRVWDEQTNGTTWTLPGEAAGWSPDGRELVVADGPHVAVWMVRSHAKLVDLDGHTAPVLSTAFSADGRLIATAGEDRTARIWIAATGRPLAELRGHGGTINSVAFTKDGRAVVTASADETARIWDASTGRMVTELRGHRGDVLTAEFSADGKSVLTASDDGTARVWNRGTGTSRAELRHGDEGVKAVFSPDGSLVASGSEVSFAANFDLPTAPVELWEAGTGRHLFTMRGHTDVITSLAFSPDGRWLLSASQDQTARVWDVSSGRRVAEFRRHSGDGGVRTAAFGPDSRKIATGSGDGTAKLYRCEPCASLEELVLWAHNHVSRRLTAEERRRYLPRSAAPDAADRTRTEGQSGLDSSVPPRERRGR